MSDGKRLPPGFAASPRLWRITLLAATLLACFLIKLHYSRASPEALTWILAPTATLVELLSGYRFHFEAHIGFVNPSALVAITPACAGVNFLIIALATLIPIGLLRLQTPRALLGWSLAAGAVALVATLCVNGVRILIALAVHREHRLEGVLVYLSALFALAALADRVLTRGGAEPFSALGARLLLPAAAYLGVTLLVPALRGGHEHSEWSTHAATVLVAVLAASAVVWTVELVRRSRSGPFGSRPAQATTCKRVPTSPEAASGAAPSRVL